MMQTLTYEHAQQVHGKFQELFPELYPLMRREAARQLVDQGFEEVGSSDSSIQLTEMFRSFDVPKIGPVQLAYAECGVEWKD